MAQTPRIPFNADLRDLAIGPEAAYRLGDLLETMRHDLKPRNCAELYLIDEMAISHWRKLRSQVMEKAVYDRQRTTYRPRCRKDADGKLLEPYEDMYHLALAHSPETDQAVLIALGRLETRYYRHFCTAYRLLLSSRRGTPPPVAGQTIEDHDIAPQTIPNTPVTPNTPTQNTPIAKEPAECNPSPNTSNKSA